ncbi:hypothetical protein Q8W40_24415 [Vibrio penaeicida]|uniref:hypothetical protein n=1 Tax=Vibrio penaeicida TaxID=104609 RepID=UPI002734ED71|nr:hypothetical protein [Vibrio penaeicida]MDP2575362.1 hypothetical protein [Vibrio penaeicida]
MDINKKDFVLKIALSNTQSAAFQRGYVYSSNVSDSDKSKFSKYFRSRLRSLESTYSSQPNEMEHIEIIESFREDISNKYAHLLQGNKLRFGTAQKAVNLYVKFLWTLGYIEEQPPHCPIDGIVLKSLGLKDKWTELDCRQRYKQIIESVRQEASKNKMTIAEWEIMLWNDVA